MSEEEKKVEVPENLKDLVETIENMKVADLAELVKVLEDKFGVSAVPMAAPQAVAEEESQEKSAYDVMLTGPGDKKIAVIKAIKKITQKGLKDCKDMVDASESDPQTVKPSVEKGEAEEMKKELEEAGASVELK